MGKPIALTVGFALTWLFFPEIGRAETSGALGPWFSYGWPLVLTWFLYVASFGPDRPIRAFSDTQLSFDVLCACWGFWVWHALTAMPDGFIVVVLRAAAFLGSWVVFLFYWGGLFLLTLRFITSIPRFVAGLHYVLVPHPARSIVGTSSPNAADAKRLANVMRTNRARIDKPPAAFISKNMERKAVALASRLHADQLLNREFVERVRREAASKEKTR